MKTLKKSLLPVMAIVAIFFVSCSKDFEQWEYEEQDTWETELRNIISDFDFLFENSCVKFLQAEELNGRVNISDFLNDDTFYPVCIKKLYNFFMLKDMDFVLNDTMTIHMPSDALKGMVSNVVDNQNKYDFVKITWLLGEKKFQTIAAFDKENGQIVYDNILTNIPLFQVELPSKKSKLTRTEGGSGTETKIFFKDIMEVPAGNDTYQLWVKCICNVSVSPSGSYYNPTFVSIHKRTVFPPDIDPNNPNAIHCYPVADACVVGEYFYYYVWVDVNTRYFSSFYDISTEQGRRNACYDIWLIYTSPDRSFPATTECDVNRENIATTMGLGLFEPEPSYHPEWNF